MIGQHFRALQTKASVLKKCRRFFCFVTVFSSVLFKQHFVTILLLMRQIGALLLIEKSAFAWYYVDTARETNRRKEK